VLGGRRGRPWHQRIRSDGQGDYRAAREEEPTPP
jgi:hypothetical protein